MKSQPQSMHNLYVTLTGFNIPFTMSRLFSWERFCLEFDENDLRLLVRHNQRRTGPVRSLVWRNLIGGPQSIEYAQEDLAMARALNRRKPDSTRDRVLALTGRPRPEQPPARSVDQILAGEAALKQLLELRDRL